MTYFRIHTADNAYITGQPRGIFTAIGKLVDAGLLSETEEKEYWKNREYFEKVLPVPPYYEAGDPDRAVTWFKDTEKGTDIWIQMDFYRSMAFKHGIKLYKSVCNDIPGEVIYEDEYQIAVKNPRSDINIITSRIMAENNGFDAVVFDMDGVIFDSERCVIDCWRELGLKHGLGDIEEALLACTGTTKEKTREIMLNALGQDFPYDDFAKETSRLFHEKYDGGKLPMKPGVVELLAFIKASGKKIALASSTRREIVEAELKDAGIIEFFDEIVCGDMVKKSKPEPDIFLLACDKLGVKPADSFAIEDSYNGIRSAYAGGLRPIMVPDLLLPDNEMTDKTEIVLDSLFDVLNYFKMQ